MTPLQTPGPSTLDRRHFLKSAGLLAAAVASGAKGWAQNGRVTLPFENGGHGLKGDDAQKADAAMIAFFDRHLKPTAK